MRSEMYVSVVIPAYRCPRELARALEALAPGRLGDAEVIVVDDGSPEEETAAVARGAGVRLVRRETNGGPAAARNEGVRVSRGDVIVFLDADVLASPEVVAHLRRALGDEPDLAAVFGSYDASPDDPGVVSRYRNLLHHFVHQHGHREAETFWAGCGAIRRTAFEAVGGFDEARYPEPSIEDIDLGYRLRAAGCRIRLDPTIEVTHLKRWTITSMIRTDVSRRALPWARLLLEDDRRLDHLNVEPKQRAAALLAALTAAFAVAALVYPPALAASVLAIVGVIALNRDLFALFARRHGLAFAAACVPLHVLYYLEGGLGYGIARLERRIRGTGRGRGRMERRIGRGSLAVAALLASTSLVSCASGWRGCRDWTSLASRDASSGSVGDVIPGVIYLAVSPVACAGALLLSPITELTDRTDERTETPTPDEPERAPSPTPSPS